MTLSKFDYIPAELIVEVSDYLDGCDLYYAFYGLNQRINTILNQQCHRLHVSFTRLSKVKFDLYCNHILPRMSNRIVSLTLCGDDSSRPGQIRYFLSRFKSLATVFTKLESLKLIDFIKSDVEILLPHLPMMTQLKYLTIGGYKRLMPFDVNTNELFNQNVTLPISLRSLAFPYDVSDIGIQTLNRTISFIEQLHIHLIHMNVFSLYLQNFPYLKRLTAVVTGIENNDLLVQNSLQNNVIFHGLKYLNVNITQEVRFSDFAVLLRSLSELHSLSLEALNPETDFLKAYQWETALPLKLASFRFDLTMTLPVNPNHVELLEPFKSKFWLSRGWLVQCHLRDQGHYFRLSTVRSPLITILYWPDDEILFDSTTEAIYPSVNHVDLWWNLSKPTGARCPNVRSIQFYGAGNNNDEPIHPNVLEMIQYPSFEHIIINDNLPIDHIRFASILGNSSNNINTLTCSARWLMTMFNTKQYEWICLLTTLYIRKLIITSGETIWSDMNLIGLCRTFINLQEITMKMESKRDLFFLLNTLENLTMANIEIPDDDLNDVNDYKKLIEENTILTDFVVSQYTASLNTSKLIFWIGSRRTLDRMQNTNYLYLHNLISQ